LNREEDVKYLAFFFSRQKYPIYSSCIEGAIVPQLVTIIAFNMAMNKVKEKCEGAIRKLISKLEIQFPEQEIMIALGVVYPQYWVVDLIGTKDFFFSP